MVRWVMGPGRWGLFAYGVLFHVSLCSACASVEHHPGGRQATPRATERATPPPAAVASGAPPVAVAVPAPQPEQPSASTKPLPAARTYYPFQRVHSPLTNGVVRGLLTLIEAQPSLSDESFGKVGDSNTASPKFLTCFADRSVAVADAEQALEAFRRAPTAPLSRESLSAENGWSAWQPLAGRTPPLFTELAATQGRFALVMVGTNDIETSRVTTFARRLFKLIDALLARGVVPIVSTIPERRDRAESRLKVPRFNVAIRAVAQQRQVPLVDLHHALSTLPNEGLSSDGIHPSVHRANRLVKACDFSDVGLRHGFNVRNLESLLALSRVRQALSGAMALDSEVPRPVQRAPGELEWRVAHLPIIDMPQAGSEVAASGPCWSAAKGSSARAAGSVRPEALIRYRFELERPMPFELLALNASGGASLRFGIQRANARQCVVKGSGFRRSLLPRGSYSLMIEATTPGALVALLQGRSSGS